MGQKATLEQIKFIEMQFNLGKKPREIIPLSELTERTVRKYISILKKMAICFLDVVDQVLGLVGVLARNLEQQR